MSDCIFCRIARGDLPSNKVYEDEEFLAFKDIHPQAPVHILIIPKKHISTLAEASAEDVPLLGRMLELAPRIAREHGAEEGFRTIINTGRHGGQEVYHLHLHILGGQPLPAMLKH
ncbi:MAG: histidine triad nucleotide-binding protein [Candidatus Dactylopiibacterium carminicum]|uniref:Histidine triad nucleotide-binding protein n=1 Tax=Candidatus Dactylopiibacterium carminicum TaxID=857335 RepID=A0A272EV11_9RHOO|nr:histidine triad nucleotide-binding protein [Candidatus Dactylopiibacterium carminicum]KAF7599836.1 histidine triad nucleotide-binding protein [Candidatus Dactylopiibacterium carminicum]PAS93947.1 MAG: histidine triad nucleotide-binding protein [Candidatus Dactylopiibacterium carminicum]PAS97262.1 MAG: histidine triad nucleotide-binding protein [Candidatus Dactylopiibacterium carminicum]PAS99836.1 MAG: histidine triad nucleotide-binding protein [Candidatus Dactylopiibacterium carminicum]